MNYYQKKEKITNEDIQQSSLGLQTDLSLKNLHPGKSKNKDVIDYG